MIRALTPHVRTLPRTPLNTMRPRNVTHLAPVHPRPTVSSELARLHARKQVRGLSTGKPGELGKKFGKVAVGSAAIFAGSAVAIGVVIPAVVNLWAYWTSSMYVWTENKMERAEMQYYAFQGRMRVAKEARQKRMAEAKTNVKKD